MRMHAAPTRVRRSQGFRLSPRKRRESGDPGRQNSGSKGLLGSRLRGNEQSGSVRSRTLAIVTSAFPRHRAAGSNAYIIVAHRRLRRNIAGVEITLDQLQRAFGRRSIATAATRLHADEITRRELEAFLFLDRSHGGGFAIDDREAAGPAFLAALYAPRRKTR